MARKLEGKVAVITGAGSGIGRSMAEVFVGEGARVVLADITGQQEEVAKRLGDGCVAVHADVSQSADVQSMLATATSAFGRLDILCNNAGIAGAAEVTGEATEENYDRVMAVNARSVFLGMRYAIPMMLSGGGGAIVNTASIASLVAFPTLSAYSASKGAVLMLTKAAAAEYAAQGIRVNCICPGTTQTGMLSDADHLLDGARALTPMGRLAEPAETARAALFLASDDSSFVTGVAMPVDGGYTVL